MKRADRIKCRLLTGMVALIVALGIFGWGAAGASFVSHAESQAKVTTPQGANIRKEASASSAKVGGAENGEVLTVVSQVQGGDGNTWYQVKKGEITGYIRSDLVEVSEGSVPAEGGEGGSEGGGGAAPTDVQAVNPVSATVSSDSGKIRDSASSEGQILAEAPADTMLTVTGQATDADGRVWYQVNYLNGETQVNGFIRYDYVTLAGELTPVTEAPPEATDPEPSEPTEPEPEKKLFETIQQDGTWLLVDNRGADPKGYEIQKLFDGVTNNGELVETSEKTIKNQKVVIIILVFLLVAAAAGIAFLVFKVRDVMDSAYFNEVEKETLRKKKSSSGRDDRRPSGTHGQDRGSSRPSGARTSGYSQGERGGGQERRPGGQGQRPSGSGQGQRPSGASQRPSGSGQGQRPSGASQGQRPAGGGQRPSEAPQGQRPARDMQTPRSAGPQGVRTMGTGQGSVSGQRPSGAQPGARRPSGTSQGQRPSDAPQGRGDSSQGRGPSRPAQPTSAKSQPRNFMADDDDEFEHEFLNYDE